MSLQGNNMPVYAVTPQNSGNSLTNGSGAGTLGSNTNGVALYTAGSNGSRVYGLIFATTDTAANNVYIYIYDGASAVYPVGQINVPLSSGNIASTPCVDGLNSSSCPGLPFDGTGKPYIELKANYVLKMSVVAAVTSGKTLYGSAIGADY